MTDIRQAAEMALDALELECTDINGNKVDLVNPAIEALRQALAEPEQEPEKEKEPAATSIHYPDCWDTACYPTLRDAIKEIESFKCTNDDCSQPEQEPVAWMYDFLNSDNRDEVIRNWVTQDIADVERGKGFNVRPLYAAPVSKPWVSLTDEEVKQVYQTTIEHVTVSESVMFRALAKAIEAKLKEKNT